MGMLEKLREELYEDDVVETPSLREAISGEKDVPVGKMVKSFAKRKIREWVEKYTSNANYRNPISRRFLMPFDPGYHGVKNDVENVLMVGLPRIQGIEEVSYISGGNLGMHDSRGIRVLETDKIPGVFGRSYKEVLKRTGKSPEEFNQNVQDYIKLHEIAESEYMKRYGLNSLNDDEHGRVESYLLRSLETLPSEGYDTTGILDAAIAVHSMRKSSDMFLQNTKKYLDPLKDWIKSFKDYKPFSLRERYCW